MVAWVANQPWSNGRVGMVGGSYQGLTQLLAAIVAPEALEVIAPSTTVIGPARKLGRSYRRCARRQLRRRLDGDTYRRRGPAQGHHRCHARCPRGVERPLYAILSPLEAAPFFHEWLRHLDADSYWATVTPSTHCSRMRTPALHVSGWFDNFLSGTIANFLGTRANAATEHARRWIDHWLHGIDTGVMDEAPVKIFVMGANVWRDEVDGPFPDTEWRRYHFDSDGGAIASTGTGGRARRRPPPRHPRTTLRPHAILCPRWAALCWSPAWCRGFFDQREIERRADVLVYTSAPSRRTLK